MDINFKFDGDRYLDSVTWDMMIEIDELLSSQGEQIKPKLARQLCAIFLTDDNGNYYPMDEALRILGGFNMRHMIEASNKITSFMNQLQGTMG